MNTGAKKNDCKQSGLSIFSFVLVVSLTSPSICLARSISAHGGSHGISHASHAMHMTSHHSFSSVNHTHMNNFHGGAEHNFQHGRETNNFKHEEFGRHNEFGARNERGFSRQIGHDNFKHDQMSRRDGWATRGDHDFDRHISADHFKHEEFSRHDLLRGDEHRHLGEHRYLGERLSRREQISNGFSGSGVSSGGGGGGVGMPYIDGGSGSYESQDDNNAVSNTREEDMHRDGQYRDSLR